MNPTSRPLFALIDCNNFYSSCERVFNPRLENQPVIVLSNNDGCVIARSNEAKALKIKMGQPFFEIRNLCERYQVHVFSSNFALYGDMSQRIMQTLAGFSPDIEVYSIDEAFIRLDLLVSQDPIELANQIRARVLKEIGIPVSVGIGPSKTLAKLANAIAKKQQTQSVYRIYPQSLRPTLSECPVDMIWGIGKRWNDQLRQLHIHNAWQLAQEPQPRMKQLFSVVMSRLIQELNGESCLPLEAVMPRKNILCSRSFGTALTDLNDLLATISHFATNAARKARAQKSVAQSIGVFCRGTFHDKHSQYASQHFITPTNDTSKIVSVAKQLLKQCFTQGKIYKKAGIILQDLIPQTTQQQDLFDVAKQSCVSDLMDQINQRFGRQSAFLAAEGCRQPWRSNRESISQRYTTSWGELPEVR